MYYLDTDVGNFPKPFTMLSSEPLSSISRICVVVESIQVTSSHITANYL